MKRLLVMITGITVLFLIAGAVLRGQSPIEAGDEPITVVVFTAQSAAVDRDGAIEVEWQVQGVRSVAIEQRYGDYRVMPQRVYEDLPPSGTLMVDLSESPVPYIHSVDFWLILSAQTNRDKPLIHTITVDIRCPFEGFFFGEDPVFDYCPLAEAQTVSMVYQRFENGVLLWRSDNASIYALSTAGSADGGSALLFSEPVTPTETLEATPASAEGTLSVDPAFAALLELDGDHLFLQSFGQPTAAGIAYPAEVQDSYNLDSLDNLVSYITLPDGGVIRFSQGLMTSLWHCVTEGCTLAQP